MIPFFKDESAYRTWISRMPTVTMLRETLAPDPDPHAYGESDVELPHFYSSEFMFIRPPSRERGVISPYSALYRVSNSSEADCCWFVPDEGLIYAAYVWDASGGQMHRVGGKTLGQAHAALCTYLSAHSPNEKRTRVISS